MVLKSINPYTNQTVYEVEEFSDKKVDEMIAKADGAFGEWRKTSFKYRKLLMLKVADELNNSKEILAGTMSDEMGKTMAEARAEIEKCAWVSEHYAHSAEVILHKEAVATEAHLAFVRYDPLGTILGVMPWNFPFWQVFRFVVPTLMAGNVVLLKHASNVQKSAQAIESLFESAGFPPGTITNLPIKSAKVNRIIENPAVKAVTLTGSEGAGKAVASKAGEMLKKSVLELGGSNAFVVLKEADIDKAVEVGVKARMQNTGQSCIAAKRFIIHQDVADEFIEKFSEKIKKISPGDPKDEETTLGPLSSIEQAETVKAQVEKSVAMGAKILVGGYPNKAMYPATLVTEVTPGMPLFDEEVFGPVAPVTIAKNTREAVKLAKQTDFGLGVTLFTDDIEEAQSLVPEFEDGAVFINEMVKSDPRLPFGGTKKSGYGRELATQGIREFVNVKTVYIEKLNAQPDKGKIRAVISTGKA